MSQYEGEVVKLSARDVRTKRGMAKAYSFITKNSQGEESGWVSYGFKEPPFKEGDYIAYEAEVQRGFLTFKDGTGRLERRPAAPARSESTPTAGGAENSAPAQRGSSETGGTDRETRITFLHSQEMALRAVQVLADVDALPVSKAQTKAGVANRFAEVIATIDKLTVKFHNDAMSGRILSNVADMGIVSVKPDGDIPAAAPAEAEKSSTPSEY